MYTWRQTEVHNHALAISHPRTYQKMGETFYSNLSNICKCKNGKCRSIDLYGLRHLYDIPLMPKQTSKICITPTKLFRIQYFSFSLTYISEFPGHWRAFSSLSFPFLGLIFCPCDQLLNEITRSLDFTMENNFRSFVRSATAVRCAELSTGSKQWW